MLANEKRKVDKFRSNVTKELEIAHQKAVLLEEVSNFPACLSDMCAHDFSLTGLPCTATTTARNTLRSNPNQYTYY